jgi:RHS repeat-associated protein
MDSLVWRGSTNIGRIGRFNTSNEKMKTTLNNEEYDYPLPIAVSNERIRAIRKYSYSITNSINLAVGISAISTSIGGCFSSTKSHCVNDYIDMNGDHFPDIVSENSIQYTNTLGGLSGAKTSNEIGYISHSDAYSIGASVGGKFPLNKYAHKGNAIKGKLAVEASPGVSGTLGYNSVSSTLLDVNGDGLPDNIEDNGNVSYNLGYQFSPIETWTTLNHISKNSSKCINANLSIPITKFNRWESSLAIGIGTTFSMNKDEFMFIDLNGDGLNDKVTFDNGYNKKKILVEFNTGTGFSDQVTWHDFTQTDDLYRATYNQSANLAFTFGIPVWIIKIIINPQISISSSVNLDKCMFSDVNNDGYVDLVVSNEDGDFQVYYSTLSKVNILKKVYSPTGSNFAMDYNLSECSQKSPSRNWQLASLNVFDGHVGDGADNSLTTFEYKNPYYDRFERASYGYDTVITHAHNTLDNNHIYRSSIEVYHNTDFLFKGLKKQELLIDNANNKQVKIDYTYRHTLIETGEFVPENEIHCFSGYYPALAQEDKYFYEGDPNYTIHTQKQYTYQKFANIKNFKDFGDVADNTDDVEAVITYDSIPSLHIMSLAKIIEVYHATTLLRSREATYDSFGRLSEITIHNGNSNPTIDYTYDGYGNIESVTQPQDNNGDRKLIYIRYDDEVQTYPNRVIDESNFASYTDYDFKIGKPIMTQDIGGNIVNYTYYPDGRLQSIQGPYEYDNGIPYTILFEYWNNHTHLSYDPDNIPWARTRHYDPAITGNEITTVLFADGLGRPIQTKKKSVIYDPINDSENSMMVVSGRVSYDAFGRVDSTWYPITEDLTSDSIFNPNIDNQPPTTTIYDVQDRNTSVTTPDNKTTLMSYGFGADKFGATRFYTSQRDALSNRTLIFKDVRGLNTSITDALDGETGFIYNALGELIRSFDPEDNRTTHAYDMLGRRTETFHPDAGNTKFQFDDANNLIAMQTQNLLNQTSTIEYVYNYNKLMEIHYPNNPEMSVYYEYGESNTGNKAGRIIKQQDASGVQTFDYGKLGELIQNIHTFVMPGGETYTFEMMWRYDSWNRIQEITYPDGELVTYSYNEGGQLNKMVGLKTTNSYNYIDDLKYDKFGNRLISKFGNATVTKYTYNPTTLQLSNLESFNSQGELMQDINYTYDDVRNISRIRNYAGHMINGIGGEYEYNYSYDHLYRLTSSQGNGQNQNIFSLNMEYSASGNIIQKNQYAETEINGTPLTIDYERKYNYSTNQPHAIKEINNSELMFEWDANGNMTRYINKPEKINRNQCWDEENRMSAVGDEKFLSNYIYDAAGERVWKLGGHVQQMQINGEQYVDFADMNELKTLYTNPYMVVNDREYTKHYYIEGQRIASKIGGGLSPSPISYTSQIDPINGNYNHLPYNLLDMCKRSNECVGFNPDNTQYGNIIESIGHFAELDDTESDLYFYHSDHIGSSSFITDAKGYASQHLQYLPFGELLLEQRTNANYYTPYKFSGKEKDDETSYSYFSQRYYLSDISIWASIDQLKEKYPNLSPYMYCAGNPIVLKDPDGRTIVPTNHEGDIAINNYLSKFSRKFQRIVFGLDRGTRIVDPNKPKIKCPYYSSRDIRAKSPEVFRAAIQETGVNMTESEKEEAYYFYIGLQDMTNYQVEAWLPTITSSYTSGKEVIKEGTTIGLITDYAPREVYATNDVFLMDNEIMDYNVLFNPKRESKGGNIFSEKFNFYKLQLCLK